MKEIGEYIDNYRILAIQAHNEAYILYIVEQVLQGSNIFVLKSFPTITIPAETPLPFNMFIHQASKLSKLDAPPLLSFKDYGVDEENHPYIVYPYDVYNLPTLQQHLNSSKDSPISQEMVQKILTQVGTVMILAHQNDFIHGSLSPDCIFLKTNDDVLVGGFVPSAIALSTQQQKALKPLYQVPEGEITRLSDQYMLATLAHELLSLCPSAHPLPTSIKRAIKQARSTNVRKRHLSVRTFLQQLGIKVPLSERTGEYELPPATGTANSIRRSSRQSLSKTEKIGCSVFTFFIVLVVVFSCGMHIYTDQMNTESIQATATHSALMTNTAVARTFPFSNQLVLNTSLAKPDNLWYQKDGCQFADQAYQVGLKTGELALLCPVQKGFYTGFSYELTLQKITDAQSTSIGMAGLAFGMDQFGFGGMFFTVDREGAYLLSICKNMNSSPLDKCVPLEQGILPVHVAFPLRLGMSEHCDSSYRQGSLTFYVNRQEVFQRTDLDYIHCSGYIGAAVYNSKATPTVAEFTSAQAWDNVHK